MSKPVVSVIIPCFNAARWIGETLGSVTSQGVDGVEIIVVDDGSTDQSATLVRQQFPQVQLIETSHYGASRARNVGTEASSGDFTQYLDADDLLMPDKLQAQLECLQRSGADVAYGDWRKLIQRPDGQFAAGDVVARKVEGDPQVSLFLDFWCPPAVYLFRHHIVKRVGGWKENLPIIQDARFALDCALHGGRFEYSHRIMAEYRVHSLDSLSTRDSVAFARDCFINALEVKQWWERHGEINEDRREALLQALGYVARSSFARDPGLFEKALHALENLKPNYSPNKPIHLALASRMLGYKRAESVALRYRKIKAALKKLTAPTATLAQRH
jgi:glycosyltransferase involved in cell wall biosynthesis